MEVYVLIEGKAVARAQLGRRELKVGEFGPGDHFGEIAAKTCRPRTATVVASTDVVVASISYSLFAMLIEKSRAFNQAIEESFKDHNLRADTRKLGKDMGQD